MALGSTSETKDSPRSMARGEMILMFGFAVLSFALLAWLSLPHLPYGVSAIGAERVLNGEIPYRDFWSIYAPGQFYLLAALFAVFGHDGSVSALSGCLLNALAIALVYRLILRITGRPSHAAACATIFLGAFLARGYYGAISSYAGVMFCLLAAFNFLELYFDRGQRRFLLAAGLTAGVGAWFKHDVAAYGTLAMLAGSAGYFLAMRGEVGVRKAVADLMVLGLSAAGAVLPVLLMVAVLAGAEAFQYLIVFPATIFPLGRPESYPSLLPVGLYDPWIVKRLLNWCSYLTFLLPLMTFLASLPLVAAALYGRQPKFAGFGVAFAVLFLFHYSAAHVQINTHIISMTLYAACLGALSSHAMARLRAGSTPWIRGLASIVAVAWLGTLVVPPFYNKVGHALLTGKQVDRVALALPKASRVELPARDAADLIALVRLVQERVPPGDAIYVGPHRHDVVVIGWPFLYHLLDRPPATRYDDMEPGIMDTEPVQAEVVQSLTDKNVQLVILAKVFADEDMDKKKAIKQRNLPQIGATLLDEFIRANYEQRTTFGRFSVWRKVVR